MIWLATEDGLVRSIGESHGTGFRNARTSYTPEPTREIPKNVNGNVDDNC